MPYWQVLADVPVVSFELHRKTRKDGLPRCPESTPFPSCLRACLEHAGEDMGFRKIESHGRFWRLDTTFVYLMGTTGAAFRLNWKPGFHMDNPQLDTMSADPIAPYKRGMESVGYAFKMIDKSGAGDIRAVFTKNIIESIRGQGRPVIARGVVGPPADCLITGFDEGGDVVIGWSYFQRKPEFKGDIHFEPNGYFRKRGWFSDTERLILLDEKRQRPPAQAAYRDALAWALQVARNPMTDRPNGFAAYEAWAESILRDDEFENRKVSELRFRYHAHQDAVGTIAEGRWYAKNFIEKVVGDVPAPAVLAQAAGFYDQQHTLMWQVWGLVGGYGYSDKKAKAFADANIRKKTAELILQARDADRRAADCIESALKQW